MLIITFQEAEIDSFHELYRFEEGIDHQWVANLILLKVDLSNCLSCSLFSRVRNWQFSWILLLVHCMFDLAFKIQFKFTVIWSCVPDSSFLSSMWTLPLLKYKLLLHFHFFRKTPSKLVLITLKPYPLNSHTLYQVINTFFNLPRNKWSYLRRSVFSFLFKTSKGPHKTKSTVKN